MKTLPFEIFQIVDVFLYDDERVVCMNVCWAWYNVFKQLLYKNITLHNQRQFRLFYSTLQSPFHKLDSAAPHVRSLNILFDPGDDNASQSLAEIALLCPHMLSLALPGHYNHHDLRLFSNLTTLKLALNNSIDFDIAMLSNHNQLHTLSIDWKDKTLTMADLESIHSHLPKLQLLSFIVKRLSWIDHTKLTILHTQLRSLYIESKDFIYTIEPLFLYAAQKYPNLQQFTLKTHSATSLLSLEHDEDGATLLDRYHAYITFAQQCRQLDTLVLGNVPLDTILLEALDTVGTRLEKLVIDTAYGFSRSAYELMIRITKSSLTSLGLLTSVRTRNIHLLYNSLSCLHLTELTLGRQANPIPIATLLDHCSYLKRCVFIDSVIHLDLKSNDNWVHTGHHGLSELTLDKVIFENSSLFDYLSRRCAKLVRLSIINSICATNNNAHTVYLHMPFSSLIVLEIDKLYLGKYTRRKEDQIQRLSLKVRSSRREILCEPIDTSNTKWYKEGKLVEMGDQQQKVQEQSLSICCQSVDRLFMNGQRLI